MSADVMISHAQNGEDVVLRRAFHDRSGPKFYVDIGACDPTEDSVTLHFYERGWQGINVEPDTQLHATLMRSRPRDANICAAVGRTRGRATFQATVTRGHGTLDPALARSRAGDAEGTTVPVLTLPDIIDCYGPQDGEIAFLKVDVEGWEAEVLASADWNRHRPAIVLVEAVDEDGRPTHEAWEPGLLANRYRFGLFDGLNRFYVREEDAEWLLPRIAAPANVLDSWRHARESDNVRQVEWLEAELATAKARAAALGADAEDARDAAVSANRLREESEASATRLREEFAASVTRLREELAAATALQRVLEADLERAREPEAAALRREETAETHLAELEARQALGRSSAISELHSPSEMLAHKAEFEHQLAALAGDIAIIRNSTSWRVSYPVRLTGQIMRRLVRRDA